MAAVYADLASLGLHLATPSTTLTSFHGNVPNSPTAPLSPIIVDAPFISLELRKHYAHASRTNLDSRTTTMINASRGIRRLESVPSSAPNANVSSPDSPAHLDGRQGLHEEEISYPTLRRPRPRKAASIVTSPEASLPTSPRGQQPMLSPSWSSLGWPSSPSQGVELSSQYVTLFIADLVRHGFVCGEPVLPRALLDSFVKTHRSHFGRRALRPRQTLGLALDVDKLAAVAVLLRSNVLWDLLALESLDASAPVSPTAEPSQLDDALDDAGLDISWSEEDHGDLLLGKSHKMLAYFTLKKLRGNSTSCHSFFDVLHRGLIQGKEGHAFLLTIYRRFISPLDLNRMLVATFLGYSTSSFVRSKILAFYESWLKTFALDFLQDGYCLVLLLEFLALLTFVEPSVPRPVEGTDLGLSRASLELGSQLWLLLLRQCQRHVVAQRVSYDLETPLVLSVHGHPSNSSRVFCRFSTNKLATYLSLVQWRFWLALEGADLLAPQGSKTLIALEQGLGAKIEAVLQATLGLAHIFSHKKQAVVARKVISKWIDVAKRLLQLDNFHGARIVMDALTTYKHLDSWWSRSARNAVKRFDEDWPQLKHLIVARAYARRFISKEDALLTLSDKQLKHVRVQKHEAQDGLLPLMPDLKQLQVLVSQLLGPNQQDPFPAEAGAGVGVGPSLACETQTGCDGTTELFPGIKVTLASMPFNQSSLEQAYQQYRVWCQIFRNTRHEAVMRPCMAASSSEALKTSIMTLNMAPFKAIYPPYYGLWEDTLTRVYLGKATRDPKLDSLADLHMQGVQLNQIPSLKKFLCIHEWFLSHQQQRQQQQQQQFMHLSR